MAVVGAGITGLAAAHRLVRDHPQLDVVVLEASDRVGGKVRTAPFAGRPVDTAADAFLARVPDAVDLCHELGLGEELVTPGTGRAYLFRHGTLHPFPPGLVLGVPTDLDALAASGVVSPAGVARAAQDLTMPGEPAAGDESVGSLVRRRLGDEVFEVLVAPLLSGVNAGDADELSVAAGAPQFAAAVRHQPSLIAGLRAAREAATGPAGAVGLAGDGMTAGGAPAVFAGLRGGTQVLTDALADAIGAGGGQIELRAPVTAVEAAEGTGARYRLRVEGRADVLADAVVVATPTPVAARQLDPLAPAVAAGLATVSYAPVVMIALAVGPASVGRDLDGSGFLVPASERTVLTACSWATSKWPHLDTGGDVILRASAGRAQDQRAFELDDGELIDAVVADLGRTMGLTGAPTATRVTRWPAALPQLRPGHLDRVAAWRTELDATHPGVALAGAGIEGLGIPTCVRQGQAAATAVAAELG